MSGAATMEKPSLKTRPILLIPAGNRATILVESKNRSIDSSCSSDSSSDTSSTSLRRRVVVKNKNVNIGFMSSQKVAPVGIGTNAPPLPSVPTSATVRRCDWITANSDALYVSFHDGEWGVAIKDDKKLFELFILSQMLSEFTWQGILYHRENFSKLFDGFNPCSISMFTNKDLKLFCSNGNSIVSETKLKTIVENATHMLKIKEEFGSFGNYCWSFVNHKPIRSGCRYARQVPVKTAKAEAIIKDMMKRGF